MTLILPSRLTRQPQQPPQLDRSNLFTRGAIVFPLAAYQASLGTVPGVPTTVFGGTVKKGGAQGISFSTTAAATDYIKLGTIPQMTTAAFTALIVIKLVDLSPNPTIFESGSTLTGLGSSNNSFQFRANSNGSLGVVKDNVIDQGSTSGGVVSAGKFFVAAVSYSAGVLRIAADGRFLYETSSSDTFTPGNFSILTKDGTTSEKSAGDASLFAYWPRLMSPVEMALITANPWQLFAVPARKLLVLSVAANTYSIQASPGSYALTGNAANLRIARRFSVNQGAYALSGNAVSFRVSRRLSVVAGSYSIAGNTANLIKGTAPKALQVESGAYSIIGRAVVLKATRRMAAAPGTYSITGYATGFPQDYSNFKATVQYRYMPRSKLELKRFA